MTRLVVYIPGEERVREVPLEAPISIGRHPSQDIQLLDRLVSKSHARVEPTAEGWAKIPQCGTVHIGDDVEIGANATIDRARFGATKIGDMVKIDNLVQVAHNLVIGDASLICAQVGLAGSAKLGKRVIVGGQAGIGGHMNVGDGAQVGGQSGVLADLEPGASAAGWPARPLKEVLKGVANTRRIPRLQQAIKDLEARLKRLEQEDE